MKTALVVDCTWLYATQILFAREVHDARQNVLPYDNLQFSHYNLTVSA